MGIDKTNDAFKTKYSQPNMYRNLYQYVKSCNLSDKKPKKGETSSTGNRCSFLTICKIGLDVSGPYPKALSGIKHIIGFRNWCSARLQSLTRLLRQ